MSSGVFHSLSVAIPNDEEEAEYIKHQLGSFRRFVVLASLFHINREEANLPFLMRPGIL